MVLMAMAVYRYGENLNHEDKEASNSYKENQRVKSNGILESIPRDKTIECESDSNSGDESQSESLEVAGEVGGVSTNFDRLPTMHEGGESLLNSHIINKKVSPEDLVRDLELHIGNVKITPTIRKSLLGVASINIKEHRGATVLDLENYLNIKRDYAEGLLEKARKLGLIVVCEIRAAKMYQYVLSNYQDVIDVKSKENNQKQLMLPNDITLLLAQELSHHVYAYHNLGFETNLTYIEDYDAFRWPIPSLNNKQKVQTFRLDVKRNCTMTISPTGTINISIGCTHRPYHLHTAEGFSGLFVSCGQILNLLQLSADNRINVVPEVWEWNLTRFDYNKDISTLKLNEKYPAIHWNSSGVLRLKYLATFFQIYSKNMPFEGGVLRSEGHYVTKEKRNLFDMVQEMISSPDKHPFTTVEEMLTEARVEIIDCV